ncbi:MAG TPA: glucosamine-6-phosphate deaminase [Methylomirabilota bacterium]|nr:glucosamine-6-phosphate deaminase [Methylomirabilota bacterium]
MRFAVVRDADELAVAASELLRDRVRATPALAVAVPAGRTPRRMYARLRDMQARDPVDFSRLRVFSVDELCPPAPVDGYFWRQVRREFVGWAAVPQERCHPFRVEADDLDAMCQGYEQTIARCGGLDLVMLGLGPNAHLASNEPGGPLDSSTRPVTLLPETVAYIKTDGVNLALAGGAVSDRAVTLGLATILAAREVVVLVSGPAKRRAIAGLAAGPITPEVPGSILRRHPNCTILLDRDASPELLSPDILVP